MKIMPCSCLHRYEKKDINDDITNEHYKELLEELPIFLNGENDKLKEFISKYIKYGDNKETLYKLENGEIKPSKQLQDKIASMIEGNDEFSMVGMQKDVLENAKNFAFLSSVRKDGKKRVYIVEGGPGTGKSVIAINLLGKLIKKYGMNCQYITKNQNPRDVYSTQLKGTYKKTEINNLFSGSGAYMNCKKNFFDALIVDEAHRVTEKTGFMKMGENQIKEIINSSRFSVFFIDPKQRVHINDYGKIVTDYTKRAKIDRNNGSMKGMKSLYKKNPKEASKLEDELIKNTYRTLLTRGQKGCYIYCADRSLAEYLKRRLEPFEEIIYPIDEDDNNNLMVVEDSEEYIYMSNI